MSTMVSQITSVSVVYPTVCSGADRRKHQSSASPVTGDFPAQRVSNADNVSIWWRHHEYKDMEAQYAKDAKFNKKYSGHKKKQKKKTKKTRRPFWYETCLVREIPARLRWSTHLYWYGPEMQKASRAKRCMYCILYYWHDSHDPPSIL